MLTPEAKLSANFHKFNNKSSSANLYISCFRLNSISCETILLNIEEHYYCKLGLLHPHTILGIVIS